MWQHGTLRWVPGWQIRPDVRTPGSSVLSGVAISAPACGMSLATICRRLAALVGVAPADVWIGNPDLTALEIVAWVQEAQQAVATAHDWSTLSTGNAHEPLPPPTGNALHVEVPLPLEVARIIPDSVLLDDRVLAGPLTTAEWVRIASGAQWGPSPAYTLQLGKMLLTGCAGGELLTYGFIRNCPDYADDADETMLGAGVPELVRMFESCIQYSALAAYRDSKGLPAATAGAQAAAALADAKSRDQPIGTLSVSRRHSRRRHGFAMGRNPEFILDSAQSYMS